MLDVNPTVSERQNWLGVLARATAPAILASLAAAPALPGFTVLRPAETGMAMVRGRMGGGGDAFNLGEMTISRCSIRDEAGRIGHGYAAGRDLAQVELIARLDALLQDEGLRGDYLAAVVRPLAAAQTRLRAAAEARAAETEVKFFTLATMRS